jgi:AcrR family transcriptional regulator
MDGGVNPDNRPEPGRDFGEPDSVLDSLLRATERVWSATPPSEITMRRIADEAGVSVGVAYNYFDSKDDLFGAMLVRIAERLSIRVTSGADGREILLSLWDAMEASPAFHRLMTWLVLEGKNVSLIMERHPVISDLASASGKGGLGSPDLVGGMAALLGISVQTFETLTNRAMGREDDDPALREGVSGMYASWFADQT